MTGQEEGRKYGLPALDGLLPGPFVEPATLAASPFPLSLSLSSFLAPPSYGPAAAPLHAITAIDLLASSPHPIFVLDL